MDRFGLMVIEMCGRFVRVCWFMNLIRREWSEEDMQHLEMVFC